MGVCVLLLAARMAAAQDLTRESALALGREDTRRFYAGESGPLWAAMSAQMHDALKNESTLKTMPEQITQQFGAESAVLHEDALPAPPHYMIYTRVVRYARYPAPMMLVLTFSGAGTIEGFFVRPEPNPAPSDFLSYKDKTKLTWPLEGVWTVYQGGRTVAENYHAATPDERFAYDIVKIEGDRLFEHDGAKNEDWFGFGKPVLADGDGTVVKAIDQYEDNVPLHPSETNPKYGNSVVIDHGNGEFSMYAHLKRGSVAVKVGDKVTPGQRIGAVGNSGNAPFAHLHYHLQTTAEWFGGLGLPVQFASAVVNGKTEAAVEPVRGDNVERR